MTTIDTGSDFVGDDGIRITVQVSPTVARALHGDRVTAPEIIRLLDALSAVGTSLEPMHPAVDDPEMATWFTVMVPEFADTERILELLRSEPAIHAAYLKPTDSPP